MKIESVKIEDLHKILGFEESLVYSEEAKSKPLEKWIMEFDDGPIFKYIYRNFKPKRHLEFGTWLGIGTTLCLEESDATVWTLNLPLGEFSNEEMKQNAYGILPEQEPEFREWANGMGLDFKQDAPLPSSDALAFCGMKYLKKNLGNRVCQIYCDSKKWDNSKFPKAFFDTILIDGDHSMSGALNDTMKSLDLLSPGGLMMWHDFCPPVRGKGMSVDGVSDAIDKLAPLLAEHFEKLFWIEPSWILVGIKKKSADPIALPENNVNAEMEVMKNMLIQTATENCNLSQSVKKFSGQMDFLLKTANEYKEKYIAADQRIKSLNPYLLFMIEKPNKIFRRLFKKK